MSGKSSSRCSPSKPSSQRPKLMRASATAPSLATSNASRKDLANLQSTRASALLSRVASCSVDQNGHSHHSHRHSHYSPSGSLCSSPEEGSPASEAGKQPYEIAGYRSSNYFSFPSFEDFQDYQEIRDRRDATPEQGIP
ncbi:hypothetical protein BJ875DRAFT_60711 [Amylocarpus encephaloides]|uniref:Uncharacterized protein n=1 Tax=Amylocarpus encephaloides TaxID=45428 RepID=A0A9P8C5F3_9HELO|nr:hypothetical protein BJ875DRAFT_60711 [Amylocarpus encephaloides]